MVIETKKLRKGQSSLYKEKSHLKWLFLMASHWPPKSPRQIICRICCPVAAGPLGLNSADRILSCRIRFPNLGRRWLHIDMQLACRFRSLLFSKTYVFGNELCLPISGGLPENCILEFIDTLALAMRAVVRPAPTDEDAANGRPAHQAGLTGPQVNPMLQLKKACNAGSIHIVGNGRAS